MVLGILAGVTLALGALPTSADESELATGPRLVVAEPVHDFGEVWIKPTLDHTFVIENTGQEVLQILSVKPGCGCTTNGEYDREIAPGQTGKIPLSLKTRNLTEFTKSVTVTTNDPQNASLKLSLKGKVKPYVTAAPRTLRLSGVKPNEEIIETVRLSVMSDGVDLQVVESSEPNGFRATLQSASEPKTYNLTIVGQPPFEEGRTSAKILINTGVPDQPTITIPVIVAVPHRVQIKPSRLFVRDTEQW
jgi:hypothetical protein